MPDIGPTWQDDVRERQEREVRRDRAWLVAELERVENELRLADDKIQKLTEEIRELRRS